MHFNFYCPIREYMLRICVQVAYLRNEPKNQKEKKESETRKEEDSISECF